MRIRHVVVQSDLPLSDSDVLALSGVTGAEHWYSVATGTIEKRLASNPLVHSARVARVFPDTLRVTLQARVPAGIVLATSGGRTVPVLVDGDGVVYKIGATSADIDLPVVSGLSAGETALGTQLPHEYASLFRDLGSLRDVAPALYAMLSEVRVDGDGANGSPDLLLYLTRAPVPVRVGGSFDETTLRSVLMVLDLLSRQGILKDIQELDFRSGDVVYKVRGGK